MAFIQVEGVSYAYDGSDDALSGVTLSIERGQYVAVLGHNGSGKSTLARCLDALLVPDKGTVLVMGLDTADPDAQLEVRRHVGMVFQNPDDQMVTSVVQDDVAFGPENLGVPQPQIERRVREALSQVAMEEYALADPAELSGGQKQRVSVAGVLAMEPDALVLDEPGAMLDPRGRRGIRRVAAELNRRGIAVVHITHFMDDALEADRVVVMDGGRVVLDGTPEEVFSHGDRLRAMGLEQPLAMRLARRLRDLGVPESAAPDTPRLDVLEEALCRSFSSR